MLYVPGFGTNRAVRSEQCIREKGISTQQLAQGNPAVCPICSIERTMECDHAVIAMHQ